MDIEKKRKFEGTKKSEVPKKKSVRKVADKKPLRSKFTSDEDKRKVRKEFFTKKNDDKRSRSGDDRRNKRYDDNRSNDERRTKRYDDDRRSDDRRNKRYDDNRSADDRRNKRYDDNRSNDERRTKRYDDDRRSDDRRNKRYDDNRSADDRRDRKYNERSNDRREKRFDDRKNDDRRSKRFDNDRRSDDRSNRKYSSDERRSSNDSLRKRSRRNATSESEILSEIVSQRRREGRTERKPKVLSLKWNEDRGPIRLNKYIANSGICSRRDADQLITAGAVTVNGEIVTELGTKVMPTDEVRYEDKILQREKPVYILLNKPKDFITTTEDEFDRKNVMMLIENACRERVYPVGRLDRNTTGLLLFTNDGEMAKKLTHPRHEIKKIYHVELDRDLELSDFEKIVEGVNLKDGLIIPDEVAYVGDSKREIGITLHSGKNRIVRRIFEHLNYEVEKLDRVYYAGLTKKDLPRGHWRFLKKEELNILKMSL